MPKKKERIVRHNFDPENPPVLTVEQKEEMKALSKMSDKDIDYSDIPPMDETKHWHKAAEHPALYRPLKKPTTVRLDADVLEWLKSKGKGYQTRINAILREAMLDEIK
jgi:uncharacterized protein (DUF4415 family)